MLKGMSQLVGPIMLAKLRLYEFVLISWNQDVAYIRVKFRNL